MSTNLTNLVVSPLTPTTPLFDPQTGQMNYAWIKFFQALAQAVNAALTILGTFEGVIGTQATVEGHVGTVAEIVQHISGGGVIQPGGIDFSLTSPAFTQVTGTAAPAQLPAATPTTQGALILPSTGGSTTLGTAAFQNTTAFDAAGDAAAAQAAAIAAAEAFSSDGSNITSGTVAAARLPALSALSGQITAAQLPAGGVSATVPLGPLTVGGTTGSITFVDGQATAHVDPT